MLPTARTGANVVRQGRLRRCLWACAFGSLISGAAACGDEITAPAGDQGPRATGIRREGDVPAVSRVVLSISTSGAYTPGTPVRITAIARANRPAAKVSLEVIVFGEDTLKLVGRPRSAGRRIAERSLPLAARAEERLVTTFEFDEPGYYQVAVRAISTPTPDETPEQRRLRGEPMVNEFAVEVV